MVSIISKPQERLHLFLDSGLGRHQTLDRICKRFTEILTRGSSFIQKYSTVQFPEISLQINPADFSDMKTLQSFCKCIKFQTSKGSIKHCPRFRKGSEQRWTQGKIRTYLSTRLPKFSRCFALPSPPKRGSTNSGKGQIAGMV